MEDTGKFTATTKRCAKCLTFKPFSEFNKSCRASGGFHNHCRSCQKEIRREWYIKNRAAEIEKSKIYSRTKQAKLKRAEKWNELKHILGPRNNERRRSSAAKIKARIQRKRWLEIPQNKIAQSLRNRVRKSLKGIHRWESVEKLTGCTFSELKSYLEKKFGAGMSWENYGQWHIDHIKPCASFDLSDPRQQQQCFHYTNLQPMWAKENISKGGKVDYVVK